ncbi:uncharacterized protein LOC109815278 [Cajanus cajan]|uniref:uncharacterized protein LOC109815278 n=1 Tax=Cajanus cajan TaxID=3821 RepID=UPI00098DAEA4|nr:uncharacterized protein LOC109815278 [Cajanus cajan]
MRTQHANDLAAMQAANEAELAALRAENEHIRSQLPRHHSNQPPRESNTREEEAHSATQSRATTKAPTSRPATHRSHAPTYKSGQDTSKPATHAFEGQEPFRRHPFVDGIMEPPLPRGWKPLHLHRYDGTTDPDEHIDSYTTQVNLYTNSDGILCRVFPISLKGAALHWYTQLPAGSIDSFNTLVRRFLAQYATCRPHHTTSAALANLRQNDDEPLRSFMERFSSISVRIRNLNPEVALHAMLMALKPGPFVDSLCRDAPRDMDELRARAAGYIQMEEHSAFRDQIHGETPAKPEQGHKDKVKVNNDSHFKKSTRASRGGRYDFYTPLNAPRVHILEEANNNNLLALPPPGNTPNNADTSKHCRYHRNHGHTTEECRTLRDRIEELIQAGHLGQYVQRQQGGRNSHGGRGRGRRRGSGTRTDAPSGPQQNTGGAVQAEISQETESTPLRGVINIIAGGFAGGGASSSARKRHLRNVNCVHPTTSAPHQSSPPISFSDKDYAGLAPNQDDPMVIVVEIANWKVQKTLIDQGSSADVLRASPHPGVRRLADDLRNATRYKTSHGQYAYIVHSFPALVLD